MPFADDLRYLQDDGIHGWLPLPILTRKKALKGLYSVCHKRRGSSGILTWGGWSACLAGSGAVGTCAVGFAAGVGRGRIWEEAPLAPPGTYRSGGDPLNFS